MGKNGVGGGTGMILSGDIGGTKTILALFESTDSASCVRKKRYVSHDYKNLSLIIKEFLSEGNQKPSRAAFGVAGPVIHGRCHATNLPWVIDAEELSREMGIPRVSLLNDLEANAWGIHCLKPEEFFVLNEGRVKRGNAAIIAAGTGLGEAGLYWDGKGHRPFACEGGHVDFGPRNDFEVELLIFLRTRHRHISYERLVSGPGILNIYQFLIETGKEKEDPRVRKEMQEKDPPRVITDWALGEQCPACVRALHLFASLYGAEAGNLALKFLSVGGMYIGGGIAPRILPILKSGEFLKSFVDKGRFREILASIPIKLILNENATLFGTAVYAAEHS